MLKENVSDPDALRVEAAGLRWLADASPGGGARVVRIRGEGRGRLDVETIATTATGPAAARAFGRALARTHAGGAPSFGCAPPGWTGAGRIGLAPLPLDPPDPAHPGTWGEFYAARRLAPYVAAARDRAALTPREAAVVERVASRVADGRFDAPQPALVRGPVARIHGDLWSGNVLWDARAGGQAVLIDPAAHGGHAETDLAMLALFGQAQLAEVVAGYEEDSARAPGWRERVALHQLHPLLVHAVLFGGGYGHRAAVAASRYA
jgi:fructosamine-3-kinase